MSQCTLVHSLLCRPPPVIFQPHFLDGRLHNAPFAHNHPTAARRPLFRTHTVSRISLVFATATRHHVSIPDFFWSSPNVDRVHTACSTILLKSAFHYTTFAHVQSVVLTQFAPSPPQSQSLHDNLSTARWSSTTTTSYSCVLRPARRRLRLTANFLVLVFVFILPPLQ